MLTFSRMLLCLYMVATMLPIAMGFVPLSPALQQQRQSVPTTTTTFLVDPTSSSAVSSLLVSTSSSSSSSSMHLSATTLDPTTVLSDILGGLLGTPAILLVPIVAALGLASLIAFFIVSYANPEVEDDEK